MKFYLYVFFISMLPLVELRLAIPTALTIGLPILQSYIICIIGNMLPIPFILLFAKRLLVWGSRQKGIGKFFSFFVHKGEVAGEKLQAKAGRGLYVALLLFVAIPVPGTGAWTGTLAASFLNMDFRKSIFACLAGVAIAGIIMGVSSK